ncbi:MAG: carboxylating nicotinate-nucleotide diphosphorylase [Thiogranum sp.]|nr:carboxylating nicotinate-nucleotide diphosphorylase [Thiogranum sp.]
MLLEALEAQIDQDVRHALEEDIGTGDITAQLVPEQQLWTARVISRESAVICGRNWFDAIFNHIDPRVAVHWTVEDGDQVESDQTLCTLEGPARALLTGERAALNFLQTLSGTATLARRFAQQVEGLPAKILDTRKTIPGLRRAQKYAVLCGGCHNHRSGLYDAFLIKENHIAAVGSIAGAVQAARNLHADLAVEVEVETTRQLQQALDAGADRILLDNFTPGQIRSAVEQAAGKAELEASGGITLDNVREYATTGVDFLSVGALTKDVAAIDLSMRFTYAGAA